MSIVAGYIKGHKGDSYVNEASLRQCQQILPHCNTPTGMLNSCTTNKYAGYHYEMTKQRSYCAIVKLSSSGKQKSNCVRVNSKQMAILRVHINKMEQ